MNAFAAALLCVVVLSALAAPAGRTTGPSDGTIVVSRYDLARTGVAADIGYITSPVVRWTFQTNGTVATSPLAADLDGDGALEIVLGEFKPGGAADGSRLAYILDAQGAVEYTVPMRFNSVASAVADLDGDGTLELVLSDASHTDEAGGLGYHVFNGEDGSPGWTFTTSTSPGEGFFASPAVTDVDGDGLFDLIAGAMDDTAYALRGTDGFVLWSVPQLGHYVRHSSPIADVDGDGALEVTMHTEAGVAYLFDAATAATEWTIDLGDIVAATPAMGDLDGDGVPEIVYSLVVDGGVVAVRGDGSILWQQRAHDFSYRSPTLVDVDGDGLLDVVEGDSNDPAVAAYRGTDGGILWEWRASSAWASGPLVTADIDADGANEVLVGTDAGLTALDAATGTLEWEIALPPIRGEPLVRDIDGDGGAEILVGAGDGKLYVLGTPEPLSFEPRTIGYWKHQCTVGTPRGDHVGVPQSFVDAVRAQSRVFGHVSTKADVCAILDGPKGNDMRARAEQQLMALWLNVVSGFVDLRVPIDLPMTATTTVGDAIEDAENTLRTSSVRSDLERAKDVCDALNNGRR